MGIKIPEADPLVRAGFSAHVTVLYPFVHESRTDASVHRALAGLFVKHDAFALTFAEFGRYPGVLYLDPRPHDPVKTLTYSCCHSHRPTTAAPHEDSRQA